MQSLKRKKVAVAGVVEELGPVPYCDFPSHPFSGLHAKIAVTIEVKRHPVRGKAPFVLSDPQYASYDARSAEIKRFWARLWLVQATHRHLREYANTLYKVAMLLRATERDALLSISDACSGLHVVINSVIALTPAECFYDLGEIKKALRWGVSEMKSLRESVFNLGVSISSLLRNKDVTVDDESDLSELYHAFFNTVVAGVSAVEARLECQKAEGDYVVCEAYSSAEVGSA